MYKEYSKYFPPKTDDNSHTFVIRMMLKKMQHFYQVLQQVTLQTKKKCKNRNYNLG